MNKKILTSIVTLGVIATSAANAAITREQCNKSDKTVWVENVTNSDGSRGACVPKNACKSNAFKDKFCNTFFSNTVNTIGTNILIEKYIAQNFDTPKDIEFFKADMDNKSNTDYIGVLYDGNYLTFEFNRSPQYRGAKDEFAEALCKIYGGSFDTDHNFYTTYVCFTSEENCNKIKEGKIYMLYLDKHYYDSNVRRCHYHITDIHSIN